MFRRLARGLLAAAILSSFALAGGASVTFAAENPGMPPPLAGPHVRSHRRVCDVPSAGKAACHARVRTDHDAAVERPASGRHSGKARPDVLGNNGAYDPSYLQSAYNVPVSAGSGQTVAIVDAYDQPNVESDLANYRSYFGLPACTSSNGCFRKVNENGGASPLPTANSSWGQEISLDVDMVSAMCPNCHILLVEANSASFNNLGTAVNTAVKMGAVAVSNSYGGSEFNGETSYDSSYYNHPGVTITVSSGDNGYGVEYPAASRYVTAVGGTSLNQISNSGTRNATETVWSGAGSGCSAYETKPSWQKDAGCSERTVADVSAEADPNTGVWAYDTYGQGGWLIFGGTSVASPIISAIAALNGAGPSANYPSSYPYGDAKDLNDITSGSNGGCGSYLCNGEPGYDGPSGLGTPNGDQAFAVHASADFSVAVSSSPSVLPGGTATFTVTLTTGNGYASPVNLSVSGQPSGSTTTFNPTSVTPSGSGATSSLTIAVPANATPATYPLTVTAAGTDSATTTHTATGSLVVSTPTTPDFSIGASPSSQTVASTGGSASYQVSLTAGNGYSAGVTLSASGLPSGATATYSLNPVTPAANPPATSTLKVTVPTGASPGSFTVSITGTGSDTPTTTHSTTVTLTVSAPATYSLAASPSSQTVKPGGSTSYSVTASSSSGYSSAVNLAVSGLPSGANASFSPTSVTPGGSASTLTVNTSASTPNGSYTLNVAGTGTDSGSLKETTTVTLNVAASDFSLAAQQSALTVRRGRSNSDTLDLSSIGGYSSAVTLSVSGLPARTAASFSSNPVTPTATSTLQVHANRGAAVGSYTLTIAGDGADGTTHTTTVTLTIQ